MPGKFYLVVCFPLSFAEAGIYDEVRGMWGEHWEFVHRNIPQSQEKQEERESCHPGAAARQVGPLKCLNRKCQWASPTSILVLHQLIFRF